MDTWGCLGLRFTLRQGGHERATAGWAVLFAVVLAILTAVSAAAAVPGWTSLDVAATDRPVWVYVPTSLSAQSPVPVVVFLHGSGARPTNWMPFLEPWAEEQAFVVALPQAVSDLAFGVGADEVTIEQGLELTEGLLAANGYTLDRDRVSLAGHSAGGGYALMLAYSHPGRWSAVWALGASYRPFIDLADSTTVAPARLYYGSLDPNYTGGAYTANRSSWSASGSPRRSRSGPAAATTTGRTAPSGTGSGSSWRSGTTRQGPAIRRPRGCVSARAASPWRHRGPRRSGAAPPRSPRARATQACLWFFAPTNWELTVKVLDGCAVNGSFWVFFSALSNVEYHVTVDDLLTGRRREYDNPTGTTAPVTLDTAAFACP